MTSSESEARSRVVASLQALLSKQKPGSSSHRIAERALDLAFNGSCTRGSNLEYDLLNEARRLIARQIQVKLLASRVAMVAASARSLSRRGSEYVYRR